MRRSIALFVVGCVALTGCTGGSKKAAVAVTTAVTTTALPRRQAPTTTASTTTAPTTSTAPTGSSQPTGSAAATSAAPTTYSAPPPPPLVGPLTFVQAKAVATTSDHRTATTAAQITASQTCLPAQGELSRQAALDAEAATDPDTPSTDNPQLLATVIPGGADKPQHFLVVEHYSSPAAHFSEPAAKVFVRAAGSRAWKLCYYPYLFAKFAVPRFAAGAKVAPSVTDAGSRTAATTALNRLATFLTARVSHPKAVAPAGLKVHFGGCSGEPCAATGMWDPLLTQDAHAIKTRTFSNPGQPVYRYRMADGDILAIGVLSGQDHFGTTSSSRFYTQDSKRTKFTLQVPPGNFHSMTEKLVLQVAFDLKPDGSATLIGTNNETYDVQVTQ